MVPQSHLPQIEPLSLGWLQSPLPLCKGQVPPSRAIEWYPNPPLNRLHQAIFWCWLALHNFLEVLDTILSYLQYCHHIHPNYLVFKKWGFNIKFCNSRLPSIKRLFWMLLGTIFTLHKGILDFFESPTSLMWGHFQGKIAIFWCPPLCNYVI